MAANDTNVRHLGVQPSFDPMAGPNGASVFAYNGSDQLITITKTVGSFSYRKTFTWVGDNLTNISTWVKL